MLPLLNRTLVARRLINRVQFLDSKCLSVFNFEATKTVTVQTNVAIKGETGRLNSRVSIPLLTQGCVNWYLRDFSTSKAIQNAAENQIQIEPIGQKILVNGIPFGSTEDDIVGFLSGVNITGGKDGVHILLQEDGRQAGTALVQVNSEIDVEKSLSKNGGYIKNRYVDVYKYNEYPDKEGRSDYWVYMRGLPYSATETDLLEFFKDAQVVGGINGIKIIRNQKGAMNGEAYVCVESEKDVNICLKKDREYLNKRYIEVKATDPRTANCRVEICKQYMQKLMDKMSNSVRVKGIPFQCTAKDLRRLFGELDVAEDGIIIDDPNSVQPQFFGATVKFTSVKGAHDAILKDGCRLGHRYIRVSPVYKDLVL